MSRTCLSQRKNRAVMEFLWFLEAMTSEKRQHYQMIKNSNDIIGQGKKEHACVIKETELPNLRRSNIGSVVV